MLFQTFIVNISQVKIFVDSVQSCWCAYLLHALLKPGGDDSYCPLSKQIQGWRIKYDIEGIYEGRICRCSRVKSKQLCSHIFTEGKKCVLHKYVRTYLYRAYSNHYGKGKPHHVIVSARKTINCLKKQWLMMKK